MNSLPSAVFDDLDVEWTRLTIRPFEADAPLIVDANAELPGTITVQRFQAIARQRPKCVFVDGGFQNFQAPISLMLEALKLLDTSSGRKSCRPPISIRRWKRARTAVFAHAGPDCTLDVKRTTRFRGGNCKL